MTIACLSSDTAYDVQCPVCGRGFLFLTDPTEAIDYGAMRHAAGAALAAQHNRMRSQGDRRRFNRDRRTGLPDLRVVKMERRRPDKDRRASARDRRGTENERPSEGERRSTSSAFRRGSGVVHPKSIFYLKGWDGVKGGSASRVDALVLPPIARC